MGLGRCVVTHIICTGMQKMSCTVVCKLKYIVIVHGILYNTSYMLMRLRHWKL